MEYSVEEMKAGLTMVAEHLEKNPECFDYWCITVPNDLSGRGCVIGWLCYFMGVAGDDQEIVVPKNPLFQTQLELYDALTLAGNNKTNWFIGADICVQVLRKVISEM